MTNRHIFSWTYMYSIAILVGKLFAVIVSFVVVFGIFIHELLSELSELRARVRELTGTTGDKNDK